MKQWDTVAIVGVGLIGGSIGLALRRRGAARHVVGIGRRAGSLRIARQMGAVTRTTLDLARGVAGADLVIVCTPVGRIAADVRAAAETCPPAALLTDVGSTKEEIVRALEGGLPRQTRFIGSHPLAGGEKNGPRAATADLFVDRTVIVTPTAATRDDDFTAIVEHWKSLGASVLRMSPADHDRVLAATSHLPHLAAAALAAATPDDGLPLVAGGWLDSTRIAAGDVEIWRQIFSANRSNVLAALARLESVLASLRGAVEHGDDDALVAILSEAKRRRDTAG